MDDQVRFDNITATGETAKAIHCELEGEPCWVPKSQITDDSEVWEKGQTGTLVVTQWWAKKAGLVED